jgi:hypothetical protein
MPQCQFPVFCYFVFQKSYTGNILGIGRNKVEPPIFTEASRRPKMRRRGARGWPHHRAARPSPWPRPAMVSPPGLPPNDTPSPIKTPHREKPKGQITFPRNILKMPPSSNRDREDPGALPGTLPERGIPARGLLHHHGRLWSDM